MSYAVKRGGSAVAYCALSIRCGTRDEAAYPGGRRDRSGYHSGIAHFTEHTLFKGTTRRTASSISGYLDRLGGELNAYTTKEEIVIHATVLKEDLRKAMSLLMELATSPTFPENEIDTERGVIVDEINSYKDSPYEEVYDRFEELLFEGHPLSGPILGTAASVRKITSSELLRFVREKFIPGNMAFTIVADLPEERMEGSVIRMASSFFDNAYQARAVRLSSPLPVPSVPGQSRPASCHAEERLSRRCRCDRRPGCCRGVGERGKSSAELLLPAHVPGARHGADRGGLLREQTADQPAETHCAEE